MNDNKPQIHKNPTGGAGSDLIMRVVRRRWWQVFLIAVLLAGPVTALVLFWQDIEFKGRKLPTEYTAQARVLIEQARTGMKDVDELLVSDREAFFGNRLELARSSRVISPTIDALSTKSEVIPDVPKDIDEFTEKYSIRINQGRGSNVLVIEATGPEAEAAALVANTLLDTFKEVEEGLQKSNLERRKTELNAQKGDVSTKLRAKRSQIKDYCNRHKIDSLEAQEETLMLYAECKRNVRDAELELDAAKAHQASLQQADEDDEQKEKDNGEEDAPEVAQEDFPEDPISVEDSIRFKRLNGDLDYFGAQLRQVEERISALKRRFVFDDKPVEELKKCFTWDRIREMLADANAAKNDELSKQEIEYLVAMRANAVAIGKYIKEQEYSESVQERFDNTLSELNELQRKIRDAQRVAAKKAGERERGATAELRQESREILRERLQQDQRIRRIRELYEVEYRLTRANDALAKFNKSLTELDEKVKDIRKRRGEYTSLRNELEGLVAKETGLNNRLQDLEIAETSIRGAVEVIDRARKPSEPSFPDTQKFIAVSAVFGLLIGFAFAYWRESKNTSVVSVDHARACLRLPVVGTVPLLKGTSVANGQLLLSASSARGAGAEHFRRLSSMFMHTYCGGNGNGSDVKSVAVTSAVVGEGKTTIAVNLAVALAKTGKKVLLIDGDLRRPALHRFFDLESTPGLADVLANGVMLDEAILPTSIPLLGLLPAGDLRHHPVELVELGGFESILRELSSRYDIVVLDCCPVMGPSETLQMARATDGVLFVVRAGRVNSELLVNIRYELERIGANTLGMILNRQKMPRTERYYYNAYYGAQK